MTSEVGRALLTFNVRHKANAFGEVSEADKQIVAAR